MDTLNLLTKIQAATDDWLQPDNEDLKNAIELTVKDGFFSFEDLKHRFRSLKKSISIDSLTTWVNRNNINPGFLSNKNVLCLHAGNIPLVGVQDVLACALTGVHYTGKISRKDPYLLPSLLRKFEQHGIFKNKSWSTDIEDLKGCCADAVLFSGSRSSIEDVYNTIEQLKLAKKDAEYLIRTAHYSVAVIDSTAPGTLEDLVEAAFRYGGMGCRSVAVVIAPFSLDSVKCELTDYIESFWLKNPQHVQPPPSLFHRYAYNTAVGHPQAWLDDFLIEQTEMIPEQDFVLHWVFAEPEKAVDVIKRYENGIQSVFLNRSDLLDGHPELMFELLEEAQNPPIFWKPDGIDTIGWLNNNF